MKVTILSVKKKVFKTDDGDNMDYFWYRAVREKDGVTFQFGSREGEHEIGSTLELNIIKYEKDSGKIGYKEITD